MVADIVSKDPESGLYLGYDDEPEPRWRKRSTKFVRDSHVLDLGRTPLSSSKYREMRQEDPKIYSKLDPIHRRAMNQNAAEHRIRKTALKRLAQVKLRLEEISQLRRDQRKSEEVTKEVAELRKNQRELELKSRVVLSKERPDRNLHAHNRQLSRARRSGGKVSAVKRSDNNSGSNPILDVDGRGGYRTVKLKNGKSVEKRIKGHTQVLKSDGSRAMTRAEFLNVVSSAIIRSKKVKSKVARQSAEAWWNKLPWYEKNKRKMSTKDLLDGNIELDPGPRNRGRRNRRRHGRGQQVAVPAPAQGSSRVSPEHRGSGRQTRQVAGNHRRGNFGPRQLNDQALVIDNLERQLVEADVTIEFLREEMENAEPIPQVPRLSTDNLTFMVESELEQTLNIPPLDEAVATCVPVAHALPSLPPPPPLGAGGSPRGPPIYDHTYHPLMGRSFSYRYDENITKVSMTQKLSTWSKIFIGLRIPFNVVCLLALVHFRFNKYVKLVLSILTWLDIFYTCRFGGQKKVTLTIEPPTFTASHVDGRRELLRVSKDFVDPKYATAKFTLSRRNFLGFWSSTVNVLPISLRVMSESYNPTFKPTLEHIERASVLMSKLTHVNVDQSLMQDIIGNSALALTVIHQSQVANKLDVFREMDFLLGPSVRGLRGVPNPLS